MSQHLFWCLNTCHLRQICVSTFIRRPSTSYRSKTGARNAFLVGFVAKHRPYFIVGRPRTHVISRLDFGSRAVSPPAMGVSTLARRAAPASRARMPGSLRSRRWPPAPPWRRPPTTSAALLRTLSSLGQPEVAGHSNGRAGQAASRLFPQRSEHVRPRVYEAYTRGRTCPPSTAESRSFYLCSARALGHWASGRRPAGEEDG